MAMSARELLANLPLQLAKGGSATKEQLLAAEKKYLANPDKRTGAQLYNKMLEQGIDVNDLLKAGVKQSTIDQVFTAQGPVPMEQFTAPTTAKSSLAGLEAQERERAIARGTSLVNKLQQGGVDAEERRRLQRAATQYGVTFEDMIRAGIDPSILFDMQLKQTPKGPQDTIGTTGTTGTVYTPGAVDPRAPGIDQEFRDSPVRERIPGVPEFDSLTGSPTGYKYTPAARLTPATGSGLSWTPPVVTSRPRQLLDVGGGYMPSASTRFAESRANQDQVLMAKFSGGERPYNYADYNYWRNRLRAGEFNTAGGQIDAPKFEAAFNAWNESTPAEKITPETGTPQTGTPQTGTYQYPYNPYSNDYGSLPSYLGGTNAEDAGQNPTGYLSRMPSATPITVGGAMMFNDGGFVKKPEGVVEESATPETESAQMLNRITAGSSPTADYPLTEEGTVDWSQRQSPASQFLSWLTSGGERQARYLTERQGQSPIWDSPATIVKDDRRNQAQSMLRGLSEIPSTVANYATETIQGDEPLKTFSQDVGTVGRAMYEGVKEDPKGFMLDMIPVIGEARSAMDAEEMSAKAVEAEAAGDTEAAKMYREFSALAGMGAIPALGTGARLAKRIAITSPKGIVRNIDNYKFDDVATKVEDNPVGQKLNEKIANDVDGVLTEYAQLENTKNGKIIDPDQARELSEDYRNNRSLAGAVQEPVSELTDFYFNKRLSETYDDEGIWVFTGGGTASGKSAVVTGEVEDAVDQVVDGTLKNAEKSIAKITEVADSGKDVKVVYMDRKPGDAFKGALRRAQSQEAELGSGRTVPIEVFLNTHQGARESIGKIVDSFKDDPRVDVQVWDNTGGIGEQFPTTVDKISKMDYNRSLAEVNDILEKAYENNEISASVYEGFRGRPPAFKNDYKPPKTEPISGSRQVDSEISEAGGQGSIDSLADQVANAGTGKKGKITFEQFGGNLGDAKQELGITEDQVTAYRSTNKGVTQKRIPEVQDAAKKLKSGELNTQEYLKVVEDKMPITPIGEVPKIPTLEEIAMSLSKNDMKSGGIVGVNLEVPDGTPISSRLDIPAYEKYDTWVVTLHDGTTKNGNAIGYGQTAVLDNVTFQSNAKAALNMATGDTSKGTIARMNGAWKNTDPKEVEQMAKSILDGTAPDASDWVEVGMNPFRHSYFYRKADGMPVADAEQVIQVGPLVLAKKAKTRSIESSEHMIDATTPPKYFKRGGNVERVYNERRYI